MVDGVVCLVSDGINPGGIVMLSGSLAISMIKWLIETFGVCCLIYGYGRGAISCSLLVNEWYAKCLIGFQSD